jgi:hypothetical protein
MLMGGLVFMGETPIGAINTAGEGAALLPVVVGESVRVPEGGAQRGLRGVSRGPRGQRIRVRSVDVTQGDAVECHLGVVNGLLELARSLLKAHRVLLVVPA